MGSGREARKLRASVTAEPTKPAETKRGRGASIAVWVGLLLSVVAVGLLLWRVSFRDLGRSLATAETIWLVPSLLLFLLMFAFRAWRWSVLLGGTRFWPTWHANIIGYFFNITLPLRLGEIARCYVISKNEGVPMARALSAVVVERLTDLATVLIMFGAFAMRVPMGPAFTRAATVGAVGVTLAVILGALFVYKGDVAERALAPHLARLGKERAEALLSRVRSIREALRSVGSAKRLAQSLALTVLIWGTTIAVAAMCLRAFLPEETSAVAAGLVVVMANLGGALPSAPGGLGVVQGFATSALVVPFHVDEARALAFVLVWTLGAQLVLIVLGFFSIGRVGLSFREIRAGAARRPAAAVDQEPAAD